MTTTNQNAVYYGNVRHRRFSPKPHTFSYQVVQWWIALDQLKDLENISPWLKLERRFAPYSFRSADYLRDYYDPKKHNGLAEAARNKMSDLAGHSLDGQVYLLGSLSSFGIYFSPINCYFLSAPGETGFNYLMAEVSNTPWNERHYYLVDLKPGDGGPLAVSKKKMHVSPFNPMDMQYHWRVGQPGKRALVHIEAHQEDKVFDATMVLQRRELNRSEVFRVIKKHPAMVIKTLAGIHWQAIKLFAKRVPFYGHPKQQP